eukprot:m.346511 g.346511  ORF g.346511 m.346511 type:complete len:524 (+) comp29445_c0_seq1:164-1735(+)
MSLHFAAICFILIICPVEAQKKPTGPSEEALLLQKNISAAIASNATFFTVPSGVYTFSTLPLKITNAKDLTILIEPRTELIFYLGFGVQFTNCNNVSVVGNGVVLDSEHVNYAQGTLLKTEMHANMFTSYLIDVDPDFLVPDTSKDPFSRPGAPQGAHMVFWDGDIRCMIPHMSSSPIANGTLVNGTIWRVALNVHTKQNPPIGSLVTIFPRRGFTWSSVNCSSMTYTNISMYAGGNEGFTECFGEGGNTYNSVSIKRRPNTSRLMSINADGFNVDSVGKGPTIIHAHVEHNGDDLFSVHNRIQIVCSVVANSTLLIMDLGQGHYEWERWGSVLHAVREGDTLKISHFGSAQLLAMAIVSMARNMTSNASAIQSCLNTYNAMLSQARVVEPFINPVIYEINFASPLPPSVLTSNFSLVTLPRRSSHGAVIRDSVFHDGAQRMGIIGGTGLVLENNIFNRSLNSVLHVENEQWALEGDVGITNVSIKDNVFFEGTIDVMSGSANVVCYNNTFVVNGHQAVKNTC